MKLVIAQIKMELTTLVRNYEQLLLVVVIPVGVLVFFGSVDVLPDSMNLERLVSSVLTLSLMSTAMVSTGIATGFERSYNVLKRLGVSPLGKRRLVWAKASAVATVEIGQVSLLLVIAAVMGWSPKNVVWWQIMAALLLGTAAFAGIGLSMAGRLRAEANLAAQNGLYLVLLVVGGIIVPLDELPESLGNVARYLPSGALAEIMHTSLGGPSAAVFVGTPVVSGPWLVLAGWAIITPIVAARLFRFDSQ
jgi:ABC-2 type transport system permease protein